MIMDTKYVRISLFTRSDGTFPGAEFRISESETYPGRVALGVYGWSSGNELCLIELSAEAAAELAQALEADGGAEITVDTTFIEIHTPIGKYQRYTVSNPAGAVLHLVPLGESGDPERPQLGAALRVEQHGQVIEECWLKPRRQRETAEAIRAVLASVKESTRV